MPLIVNIEKKEYIDASDMSSVYELGGTSRYMHIVMHLLSSSQADARWPMGGRWLGGPIWVAQDDDFCMSIRKTLKNELTEDDILMPATQFVKNVCKEVGQCFVPL